jgi:polysaccharide biosynthesis transport protein
MLQLQRINSTDLIEINVYSPDPNEAALLANAIAQTYMERRIAEQETAFTKGLSQIRDEIKKKEKTVAQSFATASQIRIQTGIIDPNPDSLDNGTRVEDSAIDTFQQQVNHLLGQIAQLRSRVHEIDQLKENDLLRTAGLLHLDDPIITEKLPLYQSALQEKARLLSSGLGTKHPLIKAEEAQIDTLGRQLRDQISSIRKGLAAQLAIEEDALKQKQTNLESGRKHQETIKTASAKYLNAKYKYIQERQLLETAQDKLSSQTMERIMPQRPAVIHDQAEPATASSRPKFFLNLLMATIAGITFALGFAFFLEYLDTTVKTMNDVEQILEMPVLAVVPNRNSPSIQENPDSPETESYRILRTNLELSRKKIAASTFTVLSGGISEGKSTTACNLAIVCAQSSLRVLLIDADMRRPSQHKLFQLDNRIGLGNYLTGQTPLSDIIQTSQPLGISVITSGASSQESIAHLNSNRMQELVVTVKSQFDLVLIDCPPLLSISDGAILTSFTDAALIVVQHRRFPRSMLMNVKEIVERIGTPILGIVINNVDPRDDVNYEYYTSYYHYYRSTNPDRLTNPRGLINRSQA